MKPLILFTAMTVIGLFGIIGTVEYSQAQTILTIDPPVDAVDKKHRSAIGLGFGGDYPYWRITEPDNGTFTSSTQETIDEDEKSIGEIFVPGSIERVLSNPLLVNGTTMLCSGTFTSLKNLLIDRDLRKHGIPNLKTPNGIAEPKITKRTDNITLYKANNITAIGIDWSKQSSSGNIDCTINFELSGNNPFLFTKEFRFTLYNQSDNKAYYFSPRANIKQAQPIPLCTSDNFDITDQTLKGDTKMCYGKHGNNMVILTKKLTGFYGATESITIPTNPIALNSDVVETPEQYNEKVKQKELERKKAEEKRKADEQREKAYENLLKRLYLPPI